MPLWFAYALLTSVLWGLGYTFAERILQNGISASFVILFQAILSLPIYLLICWSLGELKGSYSALSSSPSLLAMTLLMSLTTVLGTYFICLSIQEKNATFSSLIEMTYPIFTVLFTWLFFRTIHLDVYTAFGGILILCGAAIIYVKS